ncbi:MAG TPA: Ig-like domain-containing protein [Thermopolyspora sp.]
MRHVTVYGAGALALLVLTACSSDPKAGPTRQDATIWINPVDGAVAVRPDLPIQVGTVDGTLKDVRIETGGQPLSGTLSADRTRWRSERPMTPGRTYKVIVAAVGASGKTTRRTSSFSTVAATQTFKIASILPNKDETGLTVGVGMPVMITFDRAITDRVSVERNLQVLASKPVVGAWHWFDDKTVDFRPKRFWPANTKVKVTARLTGVSGGAGMYGLKDYSREFQVGRSQISTANTQTHMMEIQRDGEVIKDVPISAGRGGEWKYYTTNGIHLAMAREAVTVMTSPGIGPGEAGYYQETVYDTVRISNTGEYVHAAPWSVGSQGSDNVSHGCINISPENAKWFIDNTLIGDPVIVTGSPRQLEPANGWGHWQEPWKTWLRWSALRTPMITEKLPGSVGQATDIAVKDPAHS